MATAKTPPTSDPTDVPLTFAERRKIATAPPWTPEAGDAIEHALVVAIEVRQSATHPEYGEYPAVIYKTTDGDYIAFHAFHTIAKERLAELKTRPGIFQSLAYEGVRTSNSRVDSNGDPQKYELYYIENDGEVTERESYKF
jgi:hypothetical protein